MDIAERVWDKANYSRKLLRRLVLYPRAWVHRRLHPRLKVVGIAGSAGKTTTKDICSAMLAKFALTASSFKTQNYRISAAETLLSATRKHQFCILELSEDKPGALDLPIRMARPDIGALTIIGRDHYSAFKSEDAIAAELGKLIDHLPASGVAVLNLDDPRVSKIGEACHCRVIWVGEGQGATLRLMEAESIWPEPLSMRVRLGDVDYQVETQLHGEYLALPVLCALGTALALEIPLEEAIRAIRDVESVEGRMQVIEVQGVHFLRDDWKAPHWSLDLPFEFMAKAKASRKFVVVGSVSDSKLSPSKRYPRIAAKLREFANEAIFVGPHASKALKAQETPGDSFVKAFDNIAEASSYLNDTLLPGDLVLLKGTNLQDHLVRLIHNFRSPISCWRDFCGSNDFCDACDLLYQRNSASTASLQPLLIDETDRKQRYQLCPAQSETTLIIGLGNPGDRYRDTPHNLGFTTVDALADKWGVKWNEGFGGWYCRIEREASSFILFKADSPMNFCGEKLRLFLEHCDWTAGNCVIVYDDMDLPIGACKLKAGTGHGGHKGVMSINSEIAPEGIARLKIGGRVPGQHGRASELVLRRFSKKDLPLVKQGVSKALGDLEAYLQSTSAA